MGSNLNFKNFGEAPSMEGNGSKTTDNFSLARQSSIYSLTFDELQNTFSGLGKDFGSMNMDELLRNICTAGETQAVATASVPGGYGGVSGGNLQREASLTLPRTLSQKTVEEVWKDLFKENDGAKNVSNGGGGGVGGANLPQRQQTLGEVTLEEFLARAGVVREDIQKIGMPNNTGFFDNNSGVALGFQQNNGNNGFLSNNNPVLNQPPMLPLDTSGAKSSQPPQQQQQQQPIFPKQQTVAFGPSMHLIHTTQFASPGARGSVAMNTNLVQSTGLQSRGMGIVGLACPANRISSDVITNNSIDTSSLSPIPYVLGRGRKRSAALEKVVERRQRRMIKNRESAARSRARKQAYTLELEAEVEKLKEMNQELLRKQEEIMEMQKNQMLEKLNQSWGGKRQCLRRTLTGPW
ncbi:DC3 PROMOTER-BINDING FACTOR 5, abscisic acid responsive elements-binding factor 3 [Hibiscus trionum]|uniref:DC3 PROMOTER-BINDING FACTOR 5, abscisic acid responsive elements-binding factor 3 n=1 Tax=Hibiscus trionum TaxID=183268 RepID=A0A9W7I3K9_HIBTR|nr:DC3 PROMOTER-BINDING FACTOR 5, abscisic acid responsive elements-binding factor 3 [Hibiscus trionum]